MGTNAHPEGTGNVQPGSTTPGQPGIGGGSGGAGDNAAGGAAGSGGQPTGGSNGGAAFDRSKLSPILRDMSPESINEVFDTLMQAIRQPTDAPASAPPPKPPAPEVDFKAKFDPNSEQYDPAGAMQEFVNRNYSGFFGDVNRRSIEGVFANLRGQLPQFGENEKDIRGVLAQKDPATITENDVRGAYFAVMGYKHAQSLLAKRETPGTTTVTPSPQSTEPQDQPLSGQERIVARRMFPGVADPEKAYKDAIKRMNTEIPVPVGGGKYE